MFFHFSPTIYYFFISNKLGGFFRIVFLTGDSENILCLNEVTTSDSSSETFSLLRADLLIKGWSSGKGDLGFWFSELSWHRAI